MGDNELLPPTNSQLEESTGEEIFNHVLSLPSPKCSPVSSPSGMSRTLRLRREENRHVSCVVMQEDQGIRVSTTKGEEKKKDVLKSRLYDSVKTAEAYRNIQFQVMFCSQ